MIVGIGIDIVEVARMATALARGRGRLLERVFTEAERNDARGPREVESLAARFAAKEAALKAIGTGWSGGIAWRDLEVVREASGKVRLEVSGEAARVARARGAIRTHLSLSHHGGMAAAIVVLEGGP